MSNQPRWCLETCLVSHSLRVVFAYVPKAACTSIKTWLMAQGAFEPGIPRSGTFDRLHQVLDREHSLRRSPAAAAVLEDPRYFKFTFVRHPLSRLVSAYLDKVVRGENSARRIIRNFQFRHGLLGARAAWNWLRGRPAFDAERSLSFREFLSQLQREDPDRIDTHFRSQSRLLRGLPLDFVGRVEHSDRDFEVVQERLQIAAPLCRQHTRPYNRDTDSTCVADWPARAFRELPAAPDWRRFFDGPLLAAAERLFSTDFAQFGYAFPATSEQRAA